MKKHCSKCKKLKDIDQFNKEKRAKDGHRYSCRECDKERMGKYLKKIGSYGRNKRKIKARYRRQQNPEVDKLYSKKYREKNPETLLIYNARRRAKEKNLPFNLDSYRKEIAKRLKTGKCEMTGVEFSFNGIRKYNSPSVDRVDPEKGYVYGNIRIICWGMNCALGPWGENILKKMVSGWLKL